MMKSPEWVEVSTSTVPVEADNLPRPWSLMNDLDGYLAATPELVANPL